MSCGIYKITNILNQHSYIGLSINIERRWKEHKKMLYRASIYDAFIKYGINNFTFEIIEECDKQELAQREKYWISYYDTYKNGYNMTEGGEGGLTSGLRKPVVQYDLDGNLIAIYESISEAERQLNIKPKASSISSVCKGKSYECHGFQWRYLNEEIDYTQNIGKSPLKEKLREGHAITINKRTKLIARCDLQTHEILQIYKGFSEVEKDGYNRSTVCNVCNGKSKYSKGYFWKYIN